jgi:hypothetical protein
MASIEDLRGAPEEQAPQDASSTGMRDLEILENGEVFVDGGVLKLPADSSPNDAVFPLTPKFLIAEFDASASSGCFSADEIQNSGFSGTIRPDDHVHVIAGKVEIEAIDRLEAVKRDP